MLARYSIVRGKRNPDDPLPNGIRQDTRKHTNHCLRPTAELVSAYLENPTPSAWAEFSHAYEALLAQRFANDPRPFESLAALTASRDVYIGCSCPTTKNPDVNHCHTVLALRFFAEQFPELHVVFPE
jgi:uncharacterized protein YeaO (DUF488 family)